MPFPKHDPKRSPRRGRPQGPGPTRPGTLPPLTAPGASLDSIPGEEGLALPLRLPEKIGRRGSVMCPHCGAMVQAVRLDRHIQRRHSETLPPPPEPPAPRVPMRKPSPFETCPTCGKTMHRRFLAGHRKLHEVAKVG